MDDLAAVREREHTLVAAMLNSDVDALADLIDDRCVFTGPDGIVLTKQMDLAAHQGGLLKLTKLDTVERAFHQIDDKVFSTSKASLAGSFAGTSFAGTFAYTRLWTLTDGNWRVVAGQAAAIS